MRAVCDVCHKNAKRKKPKDHLAYHLRIHSVTTTQSFYTQKHVIKRTAISANVLNRTRFNLAAEMTWNRIKLY